jgi:hypothetical protein
MHAFGARTSHVASTSITRVAALVAAGVFALSVAVSTQAQEAPGAAAVGQRVRVVTQTAQGREEVVGELRAITGDTLSILVRSRSTRPDALWVLARSADRTFYVSRASGNRSSSAMAGVVIGAIIGGVTGLLLGAQCGECGSDAILLGIAVFAPIGSFLGAIIGAGSSQGERWEQLPWPAPGAAPR